MSIYRKPPSRRPGRHPLAACLALALLAPVGQALAAPAVTNCNDSGEGSLRAAVAAAASGDTIDLSGLGCHTIALTSAIQTGVSELGLSASPNQSFVLSGGDSTQLIVHPGSGRLTLSNLSLSHGHSATTGGCVVAQGDVSLSGVNFEGCSAGASGTTGVRGGAAAVYGNAVLDQTRVASSRADGTGLVLGGGIYVAGNVEGSGFSAIDNVAQSHLNAAASPFDNVVQGGGLHADGTVTLSDSRFQGNTALSDSYEAFGGGLSAGVHGQNGTTSQLSLTGSSITGNTTESHCDVCAPQGGGGIVVGSAMLSHVTIADNIVTSPNHYGGGGGFRFFGGGETVAISDSTISGNSSASAGGGMIGPEQGTLTLTRSQVIGNVAGNEAGLDEGGGGILGFGVSINLVDSSVTGNTAGAGGGGVNILFGEYAPSPSTLVNSTVSGNSASEGGGIMADGGNLSVSNSTIAFNTATTRGGGISGSEYTYHIDLQSSIVSNNSTNGNAQDVWAFPYTVEGADDIVMSSSGSPADMPAGTLSADPLLQPLAPNGGPSLTHALGTGSPAIDAGNNALSLGNDQRGAPWQRVVNGRADIGAYEVQPTPDAIFADGFEGG